MDGPGRTLSGMPRPSVARSLIKHGPGEVIAVVARVFDPRCEGEGLTNMTTADSIREQALSLARSGVEKDDAIRELETASGGRRVAVVRARQQVLSASDPDDQAAVRAVEFLDELLGRMPV